MHSHDDHKGMMWMMLVCCAMPFILLLFGGSRLFAGGYLPYIIVGALAIACISMMFRGHGRHGDSDEGKKANASGEPETKDTNKHKGCCH